MKVVILAGGYGARFSEETLYKPKPLIEIGGKPIIWHIMKHYSFYGHKDFIICGGYLIDRIKDYFANFSLYNNDVEIDTSSNKVIILNKHNLDKWKIKVVDTGINTNTAGRILKIKNFVNKENSFLLTYGDGVSDINLSKLIKFHNDKKFIATLSAVSLRGRFGTLEFKNNIINSFTEKPKTHSSFINGGFFVLSNKIFQFIKKYEDSFEFDILQNIATKSLLSGYKHLGFWQPMDTIRDKNLLEKLWNSNNCPWKIWHD